MTRLVQLGAEWFDAAEVCRLAPVGPREDGGPARTRVVLTSREGEWTVVDETPARCAEVVNAERERATKKATT